MDAKTEVQVHLQNAMEALTELELDDPCDLCMRLHWQHENDVIPTQAMLDAWVKATEGFHPPKQAAA